MANRASEFLSTWALARESKAPLSRDEAEALASDWEADAEGNGVTPDELDAAAGGDLPAYLLGIFGEVTDEASTGAPD